MKPSKYSILIIPDNEDAEKQFSLSRSTMITLIIGIIIILCFVVFFIVYALPKLMKLNEYKTENDKYASERVQIMELMQDLNRIEQMDRLIRKTLGPELQLESDTLNTSPINDINKQNNVAVSYVQNIPSHYPVEGFITQKLSTKNLYNDQNHYGIDIAVKEGESIYATASGFVVFSDWTYDFGNYVILYHGDDYFTVYGHNKLNFAKMRDFVKRGDVIAIGGGTGISSGPHLHFEVWKDGDAIDPLELFPKFKIKDMSVNNYE